MENNNKLGLSGAVAQRFQANPLTPLLALTGLLLGLFAVLVTPREEEPQIDVTLANVFIPFPGANADEVENLVTVPMEQVLAEIEGVEHIYSVSRPGVAVLSVQYEVGEPRTEAIVRLYNAVYSNQDWRPPNLGVGQPLIKPKGIDDVPIVTATLWTRDASRGAYDLSQVAHSLEAEIKRIPGTRDVDTIGAVDDTIHVELDPERVAGLGLTVIELREALELSNSVAHAGAMIFQDAEVPVQAGRFLASRDDVAQTVVAVFDGRPVYLEDVARITAGPDQPEHYVWFGTGPATAGGIEPVRSAPAVTLAVAKKPGVNAVAVADRVIAKFDALRDTHIPQGIEVTITRNYGETADAKARKLIQKLLFATASVVLLVLLALGWREAVVVGTAVVVTLAITLFVSWAFGFTINRVSLFALIFAIGILVDDAIVVVENIHRHMRLGGRTLAAAIPEAVDEIGGPTILATFTVIAALLPMAFVSGLMGPYMSPIPINASAGMLVSLLVAFIVTPWLSRRFRLGMHEQSHEHEHSDVLAPLFTRVLRPFLRGAAGRLARLGLYTAIAAAIAVALGLVGFRVVVLKMLPFDNKSEVQVVLDMPEGSSVERTARVLSELAAEISKVPEVTDYQVYAGTASPMNFNGLVRQYYLRAGANVGDIQVNLVSAGERERQSHDVALAMRPALAAVAERFGASVKVVEVPPGPPVLSPLVAEVYGPSYALQRDLALRLAEIFGQIEGVVDIDTSVEHPAPRYVLMVDRQRASVLGVSQQAVAAALAVALAGDDVTYLRRAQERYPVPVRLEIPVANKADLEALLALEVRARGGNRVALSEFVSVIKTSWDAAIYHKDLLPLVFVTGDVAGKVDSPLYGMFALVGRLKDVTMLGNAVEQRYISQPEDAYGFSVKWDGEWQITYETFRDMGLAYSVGLILIYLLVVAQFRSYAVPLVIMAPIPLTIIGVMPGHALLGANFTATSMIGMIALAGIIVRNSILLIDFVNMELAAGRDLETAVIRAGSVRAKPIALTGLAAMMGAFFILDDPIFSGLAVSLIFGILVSTLLTLVVIPILYYGFLYRRQRVAVEQPPGAV